MIKYKEHPWVSAIWFKIIDKDHIRIFIYLSSEGEYADVSYNRTYNYFSIYKDFEGEKNCVSCKESLKIEFLEGNWSIEEGHSSGHVIKLLFVRDEKQKSPEYWTRAQLK